MGSIFAFVTFLVGFIVGVVAVALVPSLPVRLGRKRCSCNTKSSSEDGDDG
jgi:uncharacterized membrane protein YgaE (UPF0421/DUF939 family)